MKTSNRNIKTLTALNQQIYELNLEKRTMEDKLEGNWQHLQKHFPSMLRQTIFQTVKEHTKQGWAYNFFSIPKVQEAVGNAAQKLTSKVEDIFLHWLEKKFGNH